MPSKSKVSRREMLALLGSSAAALLSEIPFSLPGTAAATVSPMTACAPILHPIVITDDDRFGLFYFRLFLEQLGGLQVIATTRAYEVLSICQNQEISLVITDVHRPDMDGGELLWRLRNNPATAHIAIMLHTAGVVDPWGEAELNLDGYLLKTGEPDELVACVRQVLEKRGYLLPPVQLFENWKYLEV